MDDIFESKEISEGSEETDSKSESSESKGDLPLKKQEGTEENWQSRYDKSVKEAKEERENWDQERAENREAITSLQKIVGELKNPPKKDTLQKPHKPTDFDPVDMFDPITSSGQWYIAEQQYGEAKDAHRDKQMNQIIQQINEEKQFKQNQQISESKRKETISAFQSEGLDPEDSVALYNKLEAALSSPIKEGAKVFVEMLKPAKPKLKKDEVIPPGLDGAGKIPQDDESKQFIKGIAGTSNKDIFKTG